MPLPHEHTAALAFLQVEYVEANPELYALPLAFATGDAARHLRDGGLAELSVADSSLHGVLSDAFAVPAFAKRLLGLIRNHERLHSEHGEIEAKRTVALRQIQNGDATLDPVVHNTAVRSLR